MAISLKTTKEVPREDYIVHAYEAVAFVANLLDELRSIEQSSAIAKLCRTLEFWLEGKGRLDDGLGIIPKACHSHPVVTWRIHERNKHIRQAGLLCRQYCNKKVVLDRTLDTLIDEMNSIELMLITYNLGYPNKYWSPVQKELFWAYRIGSLTPKVIMPYGKSRLRKILREDECFINDSKLSVTSELGEKNNLLYKLAKALHEARK